MYKYNKYSILDFLNCENAILCTSYFVYCEMHLHAEKKILKIDLENIEN